MMIAPEGYSYGLVVRESRRVAYYVAAPAQIEIGGLEGAGFERLGSRSQ